MNKLHQFIICVFYLTQLVHVGIFIWSMIILFQATNFDIQLKWIVAWFITFLGACIDPNKDISRLIQISSSILNIIMYIWGIYLVFYENETIYYINMCVILIYAIITLIIIISSKYIIYYNEKEDDIPCRYDNVFFY